MKIALLSALCVSLALTAFAANPAPGPTTAPAASAPAAQPALAVIVVDSLPRIHTGYDDFNLIAEEFQRSFEARHWPMPVTFERFAANNQPHALELKIFNQGIRDEFSERRLRAWVILTVNGTKHDFGIVDFLYLPRPGEQLDDVIHRMYRGLGDKVAGVIQPFIVPNTAKK